MKKKTINKKILLSPSTKRRSAIKKVQRVVDLSEKIVDSASSSLESVDNKIKSLYPKLFNSSHFREHIAFYTIFLEYLHEQIVKKSTESLRQASTMLMRTSMTRHFELKDFYSSFKTYLHAHNAQLLLEYDLSTAKLQKMTQKILQNLRYKCPIVCYDVKSTKFKVNEELLNNLYKEFLYCESLF